MDNEIKIALLDESTIEQQVLVYQSAFEPASDLKDTLERWKIKHYKNPLGQSIIVGAFIENQLVGINAYMPVEYHTNNETVKMLQSCESGVLPICQGKGIWRKIVTYAIDYIDKHTDYKLVMGFPNYINSYPGFQKMGWKTVCNMKNYVMVNNLTALKGLFSNRNGIYRFCLNGLVIQRIKTRIYNRKQYHIEETSVDNLLWNDKNQTDTLISTHSARVLKWKQDYKHLYAVCVKVDNTIAATCLYSLGQYESGKIIKLECFECTEQYQKDAKQLLSCVLHYFTSHHPEVAFVRAWAQENTNMNMLLKQMLFASSSHPNPFIVSKPESKYALMKWSLSFFDLD